MKHVKIKKRIISLLLAGTMLAAISLGGCGSDRGGGTDNAGEEGGGTESVGGTLTIGEIKNNGTTMWVGLGCPQYYSTTHSTFHMTPAIEQLARLQNDESYEPWLAESWETDKDSMTVTVHLREGIKFTDGTDFNAEAVVWNLNLYQELNGPSVNSFSSFEATDEYTVVANIEKWGTYVEKQLLETYMISPSFYEEAGGQEQLMFKSCGTGPFILKSADGNEIHYEKNPNYWGVDEKGNPLPYLDEIKFIMFEDSNTLKTVTETGDVDVAYAYAGTDVPELTADGNILYNENYESMPYAQCYALAFPVDEDEADNPFSNLLVRQAAAYAINKEILPMECRAVFSRQETNGQRREVHSTAMARSRDIHMIRKRQRSCSRKRDMRMAVI